MAFGGKAALLLIGKGAKGSKDEGDVGAETDAEESAESPAKEDSEDNTGLEAAMTSLSSALTGGNAAAAAKAFKQAYEMCANPASDDEGDY